MTMPLFTDDARPGFPKTGGLDWQGLANFNAKDRSRVGQDAFRPAMTNRLGLFVWLLFVGGSLVPLILFMGLQYRNLVHEQIRTTESALIQTALVVQTHVEQHVSHHFDVLNHMMRHLNPASRLSAQAVSENDIQAILGHEADMTGLDHLVLADPQGSVIFSWPDKDRDLTPMADSRLEWMAPLQNSIESGGRSCSMPASSGEMPRDFLAYLSAPAMDHTGRIFGAASAGLRKSPLIKALKSLVIKSPGFTCHLVYKDTQINLDTLGDALSTKAHMEAPGVLHGEKEEPWRTPITSYRSSQGHRYAGIRTRLDDQVMGGGDWSLITETSLEPMFEHRAAVVHSALKFLAGSLVLIVLLSFALSLETVRIIRQYLLWAKNTARGRIVTMERPNGRHEIAELGKSLSDISHRQQEMIRFCSALATGTAGRPFPLYGDDDRFGQALNSVRDYFESLLIKIDQISAGCFTPDVLSAPPTDPLNRKLLTLSESLNRMNEGNMRLLSATFAQMELVRQMSAEQNLTDLINTVLSFVCRQLKAQVGALYVHEQNRQTFVRQGTYGAMTDDFPERIVPGERLCGQAIAEKKPFLVPPAQTPTPLVTCGLTRKNAVSLIAFPFVLRQEVIAVIELAGLSEFKPEHLDFLKKNNESIAIALHSAQARNLTESLLEKTVEQSENLRKQQNQLFQANRELEAQTEALKKSEARLMARETELEAVNQALKDHSMSLEEQKHSLDQKNRELEETQSVLEVKAEELARSNRYKSEFLANMSHELRTPLNSIILLSKILGEKLDKDPNKPLSKFATIINASGRDLLTLIDGVLDLTKLSSGDMALSLKSYDLHETRRVLMYWFGKEAREKNIAFDIVLADDLPDTLTTDPSKLEKILKSLLSNAFKYTREGRVTVDIRRPEKTMPLPVQGLTHDRTVEFSIRDTGEGIPEVMKTMIFDAFQQADGTITRKHGGTGLGLSLAQEFARLLRGEIHLMHSDERGSSFSLFIPEHSPGPGESIAAATHRQGQATDHD